MEEIILMDKINEKIQKKSKAISKLRNEPGARHRVKVRARRLSEVGLADEIRVTGGSCAHT